MTGGPLALTLARELRIAPDVCAGLEAAGLPETEPAAADLIGLLGQPDTARAAWEELKALLGEDPDQYRMLRCMLACAGETRRRYEAAGIPDEVFRDTMGCFPRFLEECRRRTGRPAWDRDWWVWRQLSMLLFRLGTLEYEWKPQVRAVGIHIPSDADLSPETVDLSLEAAEAFFRRRLGMQAETVPWQCHSWLLTPALEPLLGEESRIRAFRSRFQLVEEDPQDDSFLEWLFQVPAGTPREKLPERTSLQRKAKAVLLAGGTIGSGRGILIRTNPAGEV